MSNNRPLDALEATLLTDLLSQEVTVDGRKMTAREAAIRVLYNRSLAGDVKASIELQKLRDANRVTDRSVGGGYLVVPEPIAEDEYEKLVYEQQAYAREKNYGSDQF